MKANSFFIGTNNLETLSTSVQECYFVKHLFYIKNLTKKLKFLIQLTNIQFVVLID